MSNPNLPLGLALVAGAAASGIGCSVAGLATGSGIALGAFVAGVTYVLQGSVTQNGESKQPDTKKPKAKSKEKKKAAPSPPPAAASPEPKKQPKKSKKSESAAKVESPPKSPAPQPAAKPKAPQAQKSPENEQKEPTKTQLQKQKKKQKKEAEEKAKAEEKALEAKREAAQAKKAEKKAQKKKEAPSQVQNHQEAVQETQEEELEEGWERPSARHTFKQSKGPRDDKKSSNKSREISDKKAAAPKVVAEVKVPKNKHGNIIGPKGSFLKLLHEKTGAKITMPKREGGGLGVVIEGEASQVREAEQAIRDIATKGYSVLTNPDFVSNEINLENPDLIGRIAGPKGTFLQAIQSKSHATLQLPEKNSNKTVISIFGKPAEITNAKIAIMDLINQGYSEYTHPGWTQEEFDYPSESLGRLIGPGGEKIKALSKTYKVKIDTPKKEDVKQNIIVIKGTQSDIDRAKNAIAELLVVNTEEEEPPAPDPDDPWQQDPSEAEW